MIQDDDIIEDIFIRIKEVLGDEFHGQIVVKLDGVETKIRQDWAGTEPYIAKKRSIEKRKAAAIESLKRGASVKAAAKESNVSEMCIYMMLNRRKYHKLP